MCNTTLCVAFFTSSVAAFQLEWQRRDNVSACTDFGSDTLRETTFNSCLEAYPVPFRSRYI